MEKVMRKKPNICSARG